MANQITGRILLIGETRTIKTSKGSDFYTRQVVLDASTYDPYTGDLRYENFPTLDFNGEKCKDLDGYKVGDVVTVYFVLQGHKMQDREGNMRYFTNARAYGIEPYGKGQQKGFSEPNVTSSNGSEVIYTQPKEKGQPKESPYAAINDIPAPYDDLPF